MKKIKLLQWFLAIAGLSVFFLLPGLAKADGFGQVVVYVYKQDMYGNWVGFPGVSVNVHSGQSDSNKWVTYSGGCLGCASYSYVTGWSGGNAFAGSAANVSTDGNGQVVLGNGYDTGFACGASVCSSGDGGTCNPFHISVTYPGMSSVSRWGAVISSSLYVNWPAMTLSNGQEVAFDIPNDGTTYFYYYWHPEPYIYMNAKYLRRVETGAADPDGTIDVKDGSTDNNTVFKVKVTNDGDLGRNVQIFDDLGNNPSYTGGISGQKLQVIGTDPGGGSFSETGTRIIWTGYVGPHSSNYFAYRARIIEPMRIAFRDAIGQGQSRQIGNIARISWIDGFYNYWQGVDYQSPYGLYAHGNLSDWEPITLVDSTPPPTPTYNCSLSAEPVSGTLPLVVKLTAQILNPQYFVNPTYTYDWTFGDGQSATGSTTNPINHTYIVASPAGGSTTAQVTVHALDGGTNTTINCGPRTVNFTVNPWSEGDQREVAP